MGGSSVVFLIEQVGVRVIGVSQLSSVNEMKYVNIKSFEF